MIIQPKVRGFICTTAHPQGCEQHVREQIGYIQQQKSLTGGPKRVLVIGASTGYGLASRITASFAAGAETIGVFFEKAAAGKRTASAGWYNSAAFERAANEAGSYAKSINGDAFSDEIKQQTINLIKQDWGGDVDLVIYSLASPRRIHPKNGEVYNSTLKPIGQSYHNKTIDIMSGELSEINIESADDTDIANTVAVMGGEDWQMWMQALLDADVLAQGVKTVAFSYLGPELTKPIYRNGTIGKAKEHLEATAKNMNALLGTKCNGAAYVSVNKGLVTQASAAIPVVPLYISILYKVMKAKGLHEGCIEQLYRLFADFLYVGAVVPVDEAGRIRVDDKEMQADVQTEISDIWSTLTNDSVEQMTDIQGYRQEFYRLFGFGLDNVDYTIDVDPDVAIPSLNSEVVTA